MKKQTKVNEVNTDAKNNDSFKKTSSFNADRENYSQKDGTYNYITDLPEDHGNRDSWDKKKVTIPYNALTRQAIMAMDQMDTEWDSLEDSYERHKDARVESLKIKNANAGSSDSDDDFNEDPIDMAVSFYSATSVSFEMDSDDSEGEDDLDDDEKIDVSKIDFSTGRTNRYSSETMRLLKKQIHRFMKTLRADEDTLVNLHEVEHIPLETLRRLQEEETGETIKKQTFHKRYMAILDRGAKYCGGVREKKQVHNKHSEDEN